jgi:nitrate/nitrite transport system ATP-binding protein
MKPFVYVESISRRHSTRDKGADVVVFEDVSFGVERGEFVTLIGHSGCGKSTILNIVAGLDTATSGHVFVDGKLVEGPGLARGVIFQNHSLLPWLSALGNVMFSLRARHPGWPRARLRDESARFLRMVGLAGAEQRKPRELSGGMRQRVGIARAFAIEPAILLMDEPFGALDALTRASIQDQLLEIWQTTGQTVIMITHDVDEALYLSDRVLVMSDGPNARIAETVVVDLPRPRDRAALLRAPRFHELRAHLLEFLTRSSRTPLRSPQDEVTVPDFSAFRAAVGSTE